MDDSRILDGGHLPLLYISNRLLVVMELSCPQSQVKNGKYNGKAVLLGVDSSCSCER